MTMPPGNWQTFLEHVRTEFDRLPVIEQRWLEDRVQKIARFQVAIDQLFQAVQGGKICKVCGGACCDSGRHHLSLANLLGLLFANASPPTPDFSRGCPFVGDDGCLLAIPHRPYNCITFFCDSLDNRMTAEQRTLLANHDRALRAEYTAIAQRYEAAGLGRLWLTLNRLGWRSIFRRRPDHVVDFKNH
ncbi:MAG: hypothetical protein JRE63_08740 [Deltaproteobacteria bacterium]|nr:hypothetical protein [Deltaproteobacteria bacterium]MBW2520071.1 hypothetical protein [Deltaproteobacteria bacterium]